MNLPLAVFLDASALGKPLMGRSSSEAKLRFPVITAFSFETGMCTVSRQKDAFIIILSITFTVIGICWDSLPEDFCSVNLK